MRLSLLSASLLLAPTALAQRFPEVEPNDTPATAQVVTVGTQIDASLSALMDSDWYTFTIPTFTRIRVHTSGQDTRLALVDGAGTTYLAVDDDTRTSTYGYATELAMNLAAGTYMVHVASYASASTFGAYTLDIAELPLTVHDAVEVEPNDTHLTATPTGVLGAGSKKFLGTIAPATVVASGTVDVPVTPPAVYSGAVAAPAVVASGTAIAGSTTTVTNVASLGQPMANPPLASHTPGMYLLMTSGANAGLSRPISSNTISSSTLIASITTTAFPVANAAGDTYQIITVNSTTVTWVPSLPLASLYLTSAYNIRMTSGANVGVSKLISANTGPSAFGSAITAAAFTNANAPGDTFDIDCIGSTSTFRVSTPLVAGQYNPTTGFSTTSSLGHYQVRFTSGANVGLVRQILGNTTSSITLASSVTAPAAGDTFDIEQVDADYWQVILTAPTTGVWFQINEGDNSFLYGYRYEIYDALGNALQPASSLYTPAFGTQAGTSGTLTNRTSQTRVWPAGTYYIAIRAAQSPFTAVTTMPNGLVPTGSYTLELYTAPMDTGGTVVEAETTGGPNTNNTVATAMPIVPGQIGQGNITISTGTDSSDWWGPIVITSPSTIFYQTRRQATATPLVDSTINLRDATGAIALASTTGNLLDVPTTTTSGAHGRGAVSFYLPGVYYIEVLSPGTNAVTQTGDYELEISQIIPAPYVAASYSIVAANTACGVAPFPTITRQNTGEVPALGSTFSRQLTGAPAFAPYLLMQGLSNVTANGGSVPLPYDLTPLGAPSCTINVDPAINTFGFTDAAGVAEWSMNVPNALALRGLPWFEQALVLNAPANSFGAQVSNYARVILGERTY